MCSQTSTPVSPSTKAIKTTKVNTKAIANPAPIVEMANPRCSCYCTVFVSSPSLAETCASGATTTTTNAVAPMTIYLKPDLSIQRRALFS
ncbi:hypothetical protein NW762_007806 [Fusarium torreyae]|uniref:Uncharacterized protein n=1 Tax=Fusarium torreyae TaxID=1237075 RepID=A0A9W8RXX5_9HYPO|nr:hypothetical protein NW762_007806 [Fusarium torreyae]